MTTDHGHDHGHGHHHGHGHGSTTGTRITTITGTRPGHCGRVSGTRSGCIRTRTTAGSDEVLEGSAEGMRTLWISLAVLGATACAQAVVVALSGSVALLGDALHNSADALTAVPLGIAFLLGRRRPTRRYTYGYGRAEDLAGIVIVGGDRAVLRRGGVRRGQPAAAPAPGHPPDRGRGRGRLGFAGNEVVARYRIRTGRRIGSAALVADGLHARTDGFTSLAVLAGAGGVAIGWTWADPVVGLLITAAIAVVGWQAAREVGRRLMDSVDPALTEQAEATLRATPGVLDAGPVRLRWVGRTLRAECEISVDPDSSLVQAHDVAVSAEHGLIHAIPRLAAAVVHADPLDDTDHHAPLADHLSVFMSSHTIKRRDYYRTAQAAPRRVPVSLATTRASPVLMLPPQAFSLSLRPSARMFLAAFTSRSCTVPHAAQAHSRTCSCFAPSLVPHAEHTWLVGSNRPIQANVRPYLLRLVLQHRDERRPARVVHRLSQPGSAQPGHAQILHVHRLAVADNTRGFLAQPVPACIGHPGVDPGDPDPGLLLAAAARGLAAQRLLYRAEPALRAAQEPRVSDLPAIRTAPRSAPAPGQCRPRNRPRGASHPRPAPRTTR